MPNYEARIIRGGGLLNLVIPLVCTDDPTALEKARGLLRAHDVEVWRDNMLIGTLHFYPEIMTQQPPDNVVSFRSR